MTNFERTKNAGISIPATGRIETLKLKCCIKWYYNIQVFCICYMHLHDKYD